MPHKSGSKIELLLKSLWMCYFTNKCWHDLMMSFYAMLNKSNVDGTNYKEKFEEISNEIVKIIL